MMVHVTAIIANARIIQTHCMGSARCNRFQGWNILTTTTCAKVTALLEDGDWMRTLKQLAGRGRVSKLGHKLSCLVLGLAGLRCC